MENRSSRRPYLNNGNDKDSFSGCSSGGEKFDYIKSADDGGKKDNDLKNQANSISQLGKMSHIEDAGQEEQKMIGKNGEVLDHKNLVGKLNWNILHRNFNDFHFGSFSCSSYEILFNDR
jgi:hypothetical protein